MVRNVSQLLPRKLVFVLSHPTYSEISALVSGYGILGDIRSCLILGYFIVRPLVWWRFFWALHYPNILLDSWGFSEFLGKTDSQLRAMSQEFCFLPSIVLVWRLRRFWQDDSLLFGCLLSVAVFPNVLRGGEGKKW